MFPTRNALLAARAKTLVRFSVAWHSRSPNLEATVVQSTIVLLRKVEAAVAVIETAKGIRTISIKKLPMVFPSGAFFSIRVFQI